jgi:hypothetical protein
VRTAQEILAVLQFPAEAEKLSRVGEAFECRCGGTSSLGSPIPPFLRSGKSFPFCPLLEAHIIFWGSSRRLVQDPLRCRIPVGPGYNVSSRTWNLSLTCRWLLLGAQKMRSRNDHHSLKTLVHLVPRSPCLDVWYRFPIFINGPETGAFLSLSIYLSGFVISTNYI